MLTSPHYRYQDPSDTRGTIAENLLCVLGTEFDYENGYVVIGHAVYVREAYVDPTDPTVIARRAEWASYVRPLPDDRVHTVYPICDLSNIALMRADPSAHPSYVQAAREICTGILEREATELPCNVAFAKAYLQK